MSFEGSYSPNILIYLEVGQKTIRLADVLNESARPYEPSEVPPNTSATLVISVDGVEDRQAVWLKDGITPTSELISLSYNPA